MFFLAFPGGLALYFVGGKRLLVLVIASPRIGIASHFTFLEGFMRRFILLSLMGLGASLSMAPKSSAVVIGNWEGGATDGWIDWSFNNEIGGLPQGGPTTVLPSPNYASSTEGATLGTNSLAFNPNAPSQYGRGYYQCLSDKLEYNTDSMGNSEISDFVANQIFSISVTFDASKMPGATYANFNLIVNGPGWGFNTLPASTISDTANPYDPGGWDPTDYPGVTTRTISWNYSAALAAMGPNPGYVELILVSSTDDNAGTGVYGEYFDDAQLTSVPEPTALGLLGLTGVKLLMRRRSAKV